MVIGFVEGEDGAGEDGVSRGGRVEGHLVEEGEEEVRVGGEGGDHGGVDGGVVAIGGGVAKRGGVEEVEGFQWVFLLMN